MRKKVQSFLKSEKNYPLIALILSGLYPLLYYYDKNYALINSKAQLGFFISVYIVLPILLFYVLKFFFTHVKVLEKCNTYLLAVLNLTCFFTLIVLTVFGFVILKIVIALGLGIVLGVAFEKHLKKVMILQLLMVGLVLPKLIPDVYRDMIYSKEWMQQPDSISDVVFVKKPNIYLIQPDGYTNFSELKNDLYRFDNEIFESFLEANGFTFYDGFRSNYTSTLSSNSSLFGMKHHFYGNKTLGINPSHNTRDEIVGSNPVLDIFKTNNYKTFLMLQVPYLLSNRPKIDFDYCNMSLDEISYISRGFQLEKPLLEDTKNFILEHKESSKFFFIESMLPSHIATHSSSSSNSVDVERERYLERLKEANQWLTKLITFISENDQKALIIIASDHGGYVGLKSMDENQKVQTKTAIVHSMFSSALAIKWPEDDVPNYNTELKSTVNLFRVLFSYLSENDSYLNHLQDNSSYQIIRKGAPMGVYQTIDHNGNVVFEKVE